MNSFVSVSSMANLAAREAMLIELSNIPPKSELEKMFETSAKHEKRILKAIRKEKRIENLSKFSRKFSNISVVLVICFTMFFTPVLSAKAVRESIAQTIIEWKDEFCRIFIESDAEPITINNVEIGYIPEGYALDGEPILENESIKYTYLSENKRPIIISIKLSNKYSSYVDNENFIYYTINIKNTVGLWMNRENYNVLLLNEDKYLYQIEGHIDIVELINIYNSIKI